MAGPFVELDDPYVSDNETKKKSSLRFVLIMAAALVVFLIVRKWRR